MDTEKQGEYLMPGESFNALIYEGPDAHRKGTSERRQTGKLCVGEGLDTHRPADLETGRVVIWWPWQGCGMVGFAGPGLHAWRPNQSTPLR